MNYHQSNAFLQDLSNSFHRWLNLSIHHPRVSQQFMVVFLVVILGFEDRRRFFSQSCPFSRRFVILARCHPLIIVFDCENSFHQTGTFHELFPFLSSKAIFSNIIHSSFQLSFSKSYRCIIQVSSNQLVISSFSCIKIP